MGQEEGPGLARRLEQRKRPGWEKSLSSLCPLALLHEEGQG